MNTIKYVCLLLFSYSAIAENPNTWTRVSDFGGIPRAGGISFSIDSFGYVGLGFYINDTTFADTYPTDFWQYNPYTNEWKQKASFPGDGRLNPTSFVIGSKAYVGLGFGSGPNQNNFWEYDPSIDTWTQITNYGGGQRESAFGFSIGGKGYVGMGYTDTASTYKKDMWEYDTTSGTWTQLQDFPGLEVDDDFLFSIAEKAYIGFGYNSLNSSQLNDLWQYDPSSDTWTQLANFSGNPINGAPFAFSIGGKGYLDVYYDSSANDPSSANYSSYFGEYNALTDMWVQKDSFSGNARMGLGYFSVDNRGYAGIGTPFSAGSCVKDFWMYTPDSVATGLKSIDDNSIVIYPNPVSDKIYISATLTNTSISILDMTGQSWQVQIIGNEINVSALPSGVYCLRLQNSDGFLISKFTKL
jgi:N-acetylneuraminic acid mutarotase